MTDLSFFTEEEKAELKTKLKLFEEDFKNIFSDQEIQRIKSLLKQGIEKDIYTRSVKLTNKSETMEQR